MRPSEVATSLILALLTVHNSTAEICRVYETAAIVHNPGTGAKKEVGFECSMITNGIESDSAIFKLDLATSIVERNRALLREGGWFIEFDESWVRGDDPQTIVFPQGGAIKSVAAGELQVIANGTIDLIPSGRHLQEEVEGLVIVARVSTADAEPINSTDEMSQYIFGETDSLSSQTYACSGHKSRIRPVDPSMPVVDIRIEGNTSDYSFNGLFLAANRKVKNMYNISGRLDSLAQFVIFIAPHGLRETIESANRGRVTIAFAGFRHFKSVISDLYAGVPLVNMHTTGHNRGLGHSFELGSRPELADDTSSVMGAISNSLSRQCYNGADYAKLGWHSDRLRNVTVGAEIELVELAFFGDYINLTESHDAPTVIEFNGFFLQYNLAQGINRETRKHRNKVLLHRVAGDSLDSGTVLHAALDESSPTFRHPETDVAVKVCKTGSIRQGIASVLISLSRFNSTDALCPYLGSDEPSDIPSDMPSSVPSFEPSTIPSDMPSSIPSDMPSSVPSDQPSDIPSDVPSHVPSSGSPTQSPSVVPSDMPSTIPSGPEVTSVPTTGDLPVV